MWYWILFYVVEYIVTYYLLTRTKRVLEGEDYSYSHVLQGLALSLVWFVMIFFEIGHRLEGRKPPKWL